MQRTNREVVARRRRASIWSATATQPLSPPALRGSRRRRPGTVSLVGDAKWARPSASTSETQVRSLVDGVEAV